MAAPRQLTGRQRAFVLEYCRTFNGTQAAIVAGYSKKTGYAMAHENLRKPYLAQAVEAEFHKRGMAIEGTELQAVLHGERRVRKATCIYIIQEDFQGLVKIGIAVNLAKRLGSLQVGCPQRLDVVAACYCHNAREREAALHVRYHNKHFQGEWFRLNETDIEEIKREWEK